MARVQTIEDIFFSLSFPVRQTSGILLIFTPIVSDSVALLFFPFYYRARFVSACRRESWKEERTRDIAGTLVDYI